MKRPDKVVIEITADGWTIRVLDGEQVISDRSNAMLSRGRASPTEPGTVLSDLNGNEELADAIDDVDFAVFGIAGELWALNRRRGGGS